MEDLLLNLLKLFIEWIIVRPLLAIFRFVRFCVTTAARRKRMTDYILFTRREYTNKGREIPALLLRIQNEYVREYNQAANYWAGRILRLKIYPETNTEPQYNDRLIQC